VFSCGSRVVKHAGVRDVGASERLFPAYASARGRLTFPVFILLNTSHGVEDDTVGVWVSNIQPTLTRFHKPSNTSECG